MHVLISVFLVAISSTSWAAPNKIQRIFQSDMIGARTQYLEAITGPALHAYPYGRSESRDYRVDGCRVTAKVMDGNISALGLDLTSRCNFNLGSFLGNGYGSTAGLTVGKFASGLFGASQIQAHSGCIYSCGNAADPEVSFTWEGPHAANYTTVVLNVVLASPVSLDAVQRWQIAMEGVEGHNFIEQTLFNCIRRYDAVAVRDFANAPVNTIRIGSSDIVADTFGARVCKR